MVLDPCGTASIGHLRVELGKADRLEDGEVVFDAALRSGALDVVGVARLLAIDPDAPTALLQGRDSPQQVRPIITGLKAVDRLGVMEVVWYERQLKRIASGEEPRPDESGLSAFLKSLITSGWGTFRTRRLRARS